MLDEFTLHVYTDGSCFDHPRRGGYGHRIVYLDSSDQEQTKDDYGPCFLGGTIGQMELEGCINGLKAAFDLSKQRTTKRIVLFTDASYIVKYHKTAMYQWWPKNDWTRADGSPVLNVPEWKNLLRGMQKARMQRIHLEIRKVDAHTGNVHNDAADKLAKQSANNAADRRQCVVNARKKSTHLKVKGGQPKPFGETLSIKILDSKVLRQQKTIRYRYEVISG